MLYQFGMNEILGSITVVVAIILYGSYFVGTLKGKLSPHPFSWTIWVTLTVITFFAQVSDNAGPGAWMNVPTILICLGIIGLSLKQGFKNVKKLDIVVASMAIISIFLWVITNSPFLSVILVSIANTLAYIPTFRKSYDKPTEEPVYLYGINFFRHGLSIFALANYSIITALVPLVLVMNNGALALFLLWRRKALSS